MTSESDLFYEEKLARQRASADAYADAYRVDEIAIRPVIRMLGQLHDDMVAIGETEMGHLTYAESMLFHSATDLINHLLASIHDRRAKA